MNRKETRRGLVRGFSKRYYKDEDKNGNRHSQESPKVNSRTRKIVDEYSDFYDLYTSYSDLRFNS